MGARFVNVDRDTPMLLPPSMQEWVSDDDMVHFVIDAVDQMNLPQLKVNHRGTGSAQYPPQMMLSLLIYCYSHGIMSSRAIERATWNNVAVRYLTANTHPDHDTVNAFRRDNAEAIEQAFRQLLRMARHVGVLRLGTVSIDGTHIKANASRHKNVRYDRLQELERMLDADIAELMARAESADAQDSVDGDRLPQEITRREVLRERLREAKVELERQAATDVVKARPRSDDSDNQDGDSGSDTGSGDTEHSRKPRDTQQINLVDSDSSLMRKSRRDGWAQAYNAQAAVDADGTQLILGGFVTRSPNDSSNLEPVLESIDSDLGTVTAALADAGYAREELFARYASDDGAPELYVAVTRDDHNLRRYDYRPAPTRPARTVVAPHLRAMSEKVRSEAGRRIYRKRKQTVEPVFGIIKSVLGMDQFLRRGLEAVNAEWKLVCTAYNMKRLWRLCSTAGCRLSVR